MNRKQKIIVSVTGIFLVLLILVGLTYAYFLTQITGNTNPKSISVTTADLRLTYGDGTTQILTSDTKLVPSANPIGTKDFTVTNDGDATSYAVIIENVIVRDATTKELTTFNSNDFVYTLSCTSNNGTCNGVSEQTVLPMSDNILVENDIAKNEIHTYEIVVYYLETNKDQSKDMNKTLEARINIEDANRINPYSSNTNSLAYNIINNAMNVTQEEINNGYAVYRSTPLTKPLEESSSYYKINEDNVTYSHEVSDKADYYILVGDNLSFSIQNGMPGFVLVNPQIYKISDNYNKLVGKYVYGNYATYEQAEKNMQKYILYPSKIVSSTPFSYVVNEYAISVESLENSLTQTPDSYTNNTGFSSFYYRGGVKNNYLEFNDMCWRIVRIQGDGSVKLALAKNQKCSTINDSIDETSAFIGEGSFGFSSRKSVDNEEYDVLDYKNSTNGMRSILNKWLNEQFDSNIKSKIKFDDWCIGNLRDAFDSNGNAIGTSMDIINTNPFSMFNYSAYNRYLSNTPSLICDNTGLSNEVDYNQIGTFTMDEIAYAGASRLYWVTMHEFTYLDDNASVNGSKGMLTLTPHSYSIAHGGDSIYSYINYGPFDYLFDEGKIRPMITLIPEIEFATNSGDGTQTNPYRIIES